MRLGIDFDNTLVCYDALFHRVALEAGLIPATLPVNKSDVRNHLRATGREAAWTEMQGTVYGARMSEAAPYPGVEEFLARCRDAGIEVFIISHKTRTPFAGPPHDLHAAARRWLRERGFLSPDVAFFEQTKAEKLARIASCRCTHFIDDLPEILAEPNFPPGVHRILFDPHHLYPEEARFRRIHSWAEAAVFLPPGPAAPPPSAPPPPRTEAVASLLAAAGFAATSPPLAPLPGGANNRVFALEAGGRPVVLKQYFHAPGDRRDRFGAEQAFYHWAWTQGVRQIPEPLAWDPHHRLGLLERVPGRKLAPEELAWDHLAQAIALVAALNQRRHDRGALAVPQAAEACFSIAEHLSRVDQRIARLAHIPRDLPVDREAAVFLQRELAPAWETLRTGILDQAGLDPTLELAPERRCLSPSDFGFHNALLDTGGRLRFLDFEYAGWDDPAKLVGDFFSQPRVPIDLAHWDRFVGGLDHALGWGGQLGARALLLLPAYRVKWCCILLNEFLPADGTRRAFAAGDTDPEALAARKTTQLQKSRLALHASRALLP